MASLSAIATFRRASTASSLSCKDLMVSTCSASDLSKPGRLSTRFSKVLPSFTRSVAKARFLLSKSADSSGRCVSFSLALDSCQRVINTNGTGDGDGHNLRLAYKGLVFMLIVEVVQDLVHALAHLTHILASGTGSRHDRHATHPVHLLLELRTDVHGRPPPIGASLFSRVPFSYKYRYRYE